jgi:signal transduction histidine kinase
VRSEDRAPGAHRVRVRRPRRAGAVASAVGVALAVAVVAATGAFLLGPSAGWWALAVVGAIPIPVAVVRPLIVRPRIAARAVALAAATAVAVIAGALLVALALVGRPRGDERVAVAATIVGVAVGVAVGPLAHRRLVAATNRLLLGRAVDPSSALQGFTNQLSRAVPLDELLLQLAERLRRALRLSAAEVWLVRGEHLELAISSPPRTRDALALGDDEVSVVARSGPAGGTWVELWLPGLVGERAASRLRVVPLAQHGELLGLLVCEAAVDADPPDDEDQLLRDIGRAVAQALQTAHLDAALEESTAELRRTNVELRASRARVVAAADAARRGIERDLHDATQQELVAVALHLRVAARLVRESPDEAVAVIDQLVDDVRDVQHAVRDLAHGIYPPLLVESGLPEALRVAAARAAVDVELDVVVPRQAAAVEAAVYFCCLEALQNAAKHAPGSRVQLRVAVARHGDGDSVCFEVVDDGPGFDVRRASPGQGLVNMVDRLGAIGGRCTVDAEPGQGTRVTGVIPVGAEQDVQSNNPRSETIRPMLGGT